MKFLLDENVDPRLVDHLRALGHDVTAIIFDYTRSIEDTEVLTIALREALQQKNHVLRPFA
jgi:predicted nuclease of predicted toxin-antitoxin system